MKMKNLKLWALLGAFLCIFPVTQAEEFSQWDEDPELHAKFPMCDRILNVEWISPERRIGVAHYTLYAEDGSSRNMNAIIALQDDDPRFRNHYSALPVDQLSLSLHKDIILTELPDTPFLQEWQIDAIINWDYLPESTIFQYGRGLRFWRDDKNFYILPDLLGSTGQIESLTRHTQNVCIVYPERDYAWIVELGYENGISTVDFNHDGMNDDFFKGASYDGQYYPLELYRYDPPGSSSWEERIRFAPTGKDICFSTVTSTVYFKTDGYNYYVVKTPFVECNLTELTQ